LVSVDGGTTATYIYDHQNRRLKKSVGSGTHYVWQGSQVLSEHNASSGAVLIDYVYAGSQMIAMEDGNRKFFLSDRLSVRAVITDGNGGIQGVQSHLPFGEDLTSTGQTEKHRLTSYERDNETPLDYAVNRAYSPGNGRFTSVDRIRGDLGHPQRLNRYAYAKSDPINRIDRLGLDDEHGCHDDQIWDPDAEPPRCVPNTVDITVTVSAGQDPIDPDPNAGTGPLAPGTIAGEALSIEQDLRQESFGVHTAVDCEIIDIPLSEAQMMKVLASVDAALGKLDKPLCRAILFVQNEADPQSDPKTRLEQLKAASAFTYGSGSFVCEGKIINYEAAWQANEGEIIFGPAFFQHLAGRTFSSGKTLTADELEVLTVLHELGHATGAPFADHSQGQSFAYDDLIAQACFGN
jgi:RHS repeat-associated protein